MAPDEDADAWALPSSVDNVAPLSMMMVLGNRLNLPSGVAVPASEITKLCTARYFQVEGLVTDSPAPVSANW